MAGGSSVEADEGNRQSVREFDNNKLVQVVIHRFKYDTKQIHVGSENLVAFDLLWAPPTAGFSVGLSRPYDTCCGVLGILCPSMQQGFVVIITIRAAITNGQLLKISYSLPITGHRPTFNVDVSKLRQLSTRIQLDTILFVTHRIIIVRGICPKIFYLPGTSSGRIPCGTELSNVWVKRPSDTFRGVLGIYALRCSWVSSWLWWLEQQYLVNPWTVPQNQYSHRSMSTLMFCASCQLEFKSIQRFSSLAVLDCRKIFYLHGTSSGRIPCWTELCNVWVERP